METTMFHPHRIICAGLLALAAGAAAAQDASPGYIGAAYAVGSNYSVGCEAGDTCHTHANSGGKVYAGYTLGSNNFLGIDSTHAIEFGLYEIGHSREVTPYGYIDSSAGGATLTYASSLKLTDAWSIDTRIGASYAHTTSYVVDTVDHFSYAQNAHDSFGVTGGLGLAYAINKHWSVTADVDYLPLKFGSEGPRDHVYMMSLGGAYHF
jgi:hypothetical protein